MWRCGICETLNDEQAARCVVCDSPRPEPESSPDTIASPGHDSPPETVPETETWIEMASEELYPDADEPRRVRKRWWILAPALVVLAAALAGFIFIEFRYRSAGEMYAAGDYDAAQTAYSKIEWYRDSAELAKSARNEAYIADGLALMDEGDYSGARASFEMTGAEAQTYIEKSFYRESDALKNAGNYAAARNALAAASDSAEKQTALANIYYAEAVALCGAGDYTGAQAALENAADVEDVYGIGEKLAVAFASGKAQTPLESDSAEAPGLPVEEIYAQGVEYLDAGDGIGAQLSFMRAAGYLDSAQRARELAYMNGRRMAAGGMHSVWIEGGAVYAEGNNYFGQCNVSDWSGMVQVTAGRYHTVGLRADGTVAATGSNEWGQCRVEEWTGIVAIATGGYHTVGLKADGTVVAVGWDAYGQCGVRAWTDVVRIAAGERHTVGVKADGTAIASGDNSNGQRAVSAWRDIIDVACGQLHTVGLMADGTLVAVGWNECGQCDVGGIENAVAVDAGWYHTSCITMSGEIACTGDDTYGQAQPGAPENTYALCAGGVHTMYFSVDGGRQLVGAYYNQLSVGANDGDVALLQRALTDAGWYAGEIDGIYNEDTAQAVACMQTAMGHEPTGVADPEFLKLIYAGY